MSKFVEKLIARVLESSGVSILCSYIRCREEFYKTGNRNTEADEGRSVEESAAGWHSGLFNFDDDFFWRSRNTPKNRPGQSDKETDDEDAGREPFDVDFVSQPVGGRPAEGSDIGFGPDAAAAVNPFFPFGNNFGFGGLFPFNFGGSEYKPWWKG